MGIPLGTAEGETVICETFLICNVGAALGLFLIGTPVDVGSFARLGDAVTERKGASDEGLKEGEEVLTMVDGEADEVGWGEGDDEEGGGEGRRGEAACTISGIQQQQQQQHRISRCSHATNGGIVDLVVFLPQQRWQLFFVV